MEESEVELVAWVSMKQIQDILALKDGIQHIPKYIGKFQAMLPGLQVTEIDNQLLFPCYRNKLGQGLGEAHAKALKYVASIL